jgi:hypothetical protein
VRLQSQRSSLPDEISNQEKKMPTIIIELDIVQAQELASVARGKAKGIDWVLENKPPVPKKAAELDERAKILTQAATTIETALHQRALGNVVPLGGKNVK